MYKVTTPALPADLKRFLFTSGTTWWFEDSWSEQQQHTFNLQKLCWGIIQLWVVLPSLVCGCRLSEDSISWQHITKGTKCLFGFCSSPSLMELVCKAFLLFLSFSREAGVGKRFRIPEQLTKPCTQQKIMFLIFFKEFDRKAQGGTPNVNLLLHFCLLLL